MLLSHHLKRELVNLPSYFVSKDASKVSIITHKIGDNAFYMFDYLMKNERSYDVEFVLFQGDFRISNYHAISEKFHDVYGKKPLLLKSKGGLMAYYKSKWVFTDVVVPTNKVVRNQIHVQLWHGYIGKRLGYMNPLQLDGTPLLKWSTSIFTTQSSLLALQFIAQFRLDPSKFVITTSPRFDRVLSKKSKAKILLEQIGIDTSFKYLLLAAPTFRRDNLNRISVEKSVGVLKAYVSKKMQDFLKERDALLVLKPHPSLTPYLKNLELDSPNIAVLNNLDLYLNLSGITDILPAFDVLITDYSSVFVDYLLLDRPVIFYVPDFDEVKDSLGYTVTFDVYIPGPKVRNPDGLVSAIDKALGSKTNGDTYRERRECIKQVLFEKVYPRNNTEVLLRDIGFI
ncbi:CDP-glycerol glycerophosphotransferase family protein [Thermococcus sp.]|uniref:CDP-glycerol glycerophosphotransferase family protein n=1 Tax=Thermococcus sp. TaxID=35749 RepID=UPI002618A0FA|nr:CDP-glycerol glycerophosphotransferase family protein [Thermococcus sp.]